MEMNIEINNKKYINSNNYSDYFFIDANICCEIEENKFINFQTGHHYYMNDYNLPANNLEIYATDEFSEICKKIHMIYEDFINDLNDSFNTKFTLSQVEELKEKINNALCDAESLIKDAEIEAEKEMQEDKCIYVEQHFIEMYDEEFNAKRAYAEPEFLSFDSEEEANIFVNNNDNCEIVSKEYYYSKK